MKKTYAFILSLVLIASALVAGAIFYFARSAQPIPAAVAPQSLGGQIYHQAANPLGNKLPDTNPAKNANPIQGLNVNPF